MDEDFIEDEASLFLLLNKCHRRQKKAPKSVKSQDFGLEIFRRIKQYKEYRKN